MIARLFSLVAIPVLFASPASAQSADAPATPKAAAQESYARGWKLFDRAEQKHDRALYEAAYLQFSQGYAIYQDDKILWNLLVAEMMTDRYVDGLRHLRSYDRRPHGSDPRRHLPEFNAVVDKASKATGHLVVEAPVGARLRLDETDVGVAPAPDPFDVTPGAHKMEAVLASGKTLVASATPAAGETTHVTLAEPAPEPATVSPPLPPEAGPAPTSPLPSDAKEASGTGFLTTRNTVALGFGVVAVAAVAGAVGLEVAAGSDRSRANQIGAQLPDGDNACAAGTALPQCAQFSSANNSAASHQNAATALFVTGGVAGVAAVGVLLFWPSRVTARSGVLSPLVLPSTGGLQWLGTF